ncbi:uncharacterized protein LOC124140837 isoform X1 [Haliotis rufescens]|uniref:uncharacterized protein LOC124140837 isoform X1 n=1 Tax=Haliotis rufescens TaxID=6454 RepID=UPI001EB04FF5|nr:uncharacterized protein LOC124140837 isoform X1 [Haliotis rufescens]XP_046364584.1 uncharacterized protein LOC124140837 isoform X1 [Haliotis rufescens]XP_046364592.1 uncharacterized protein LOC124140837 isoform X1 [Haliotis rufescens]XP_046364602.1 uncharacterized protein LOC124140837 isoform X1 [Haliotis rufescens]XP_046364612.1 uncharacterized protein LOC124140837 isoform X1 [Haliotis rufescens]XP_046364621.1 uncharacterized protein LOC124140837 isoform X1 [Haliotis rufescens]
MRRSPEPTFIGLLSHIIPSTFPHVQSARKGNRPHVSNQVRLPVKKRLLCAIVFLLLLVSSCVAYPNPRIEAPKGKTPGAMYYRTANCRPLTDEQLQKRMGSSFDGSRMGSDLESLRLADSADRVQEDGYSDEEDLDEFQGDDPSADIEDDVIYGENEDVDEEDEYIENKHEDAKERTYEDKAQVFNYMRRKRGVSDDELSHRGPHLTKRGSLSDFGTLHLKLALSGRRNKGHRSHDARSRKQLKKELRDKVKKSNKDPPWECKMKHEYKKMKEGIFPPYVTDAKCVTDKCFFRIYNCVPKKYKIRLLMRDPDRCNPLPLIGTNTTYEEKWYFTYQFVTVACNCERRKAKKRKRH